jgi:hypothetical protein
MACPWRGSWVDNVKSIYAFLERIRMKNLFDAALADQVKRRIYQLRPDSGRQWGKRSPAQVMAHCALGLEMALGEIRLRRKLIGRLLGLVLKPLVLGNDEEFRRNTPTFDELAVSGEKDLPAESKRLGSLIDRFVSGGPPVCTSHPHPYFGPLMPMEWAILEYKHLDHHLRQFNV